MEHKRPKNAPDGFWLSRREAFLSALFAAVADFPAALVLYLNSSTYLRAEFRLIVAVPLSAFLCT